MQRQNNSNSGGRDGVRTNFQGGGQRGQVDGGQERRTSSAPSGNGRILNSSGGGGSGAGRGRGKAEYIYLYIYFSHLILFSFLLLNIPYYLIFF